jgi:glutamate/tyrosine decarboxylase-like PLP-dependent enzyme
LGLPEKFLLKNVGGGIIANNVTESVMLSINAAKHRAMKRLGIEGNDPRVLKFVGYYSDQCHPGADRALKLKDIYYRRAVPTVYNQKLKNFELDLEGFTEMIQSDER